ncbi:LytR C-terminal domain-containing protein [candidate division KSB1 bacterium]
MVKRRTRKKKTRKIKEQKFDITSIIFAFCIVIIIGAVIYYAFIKIKSSPPGDTAENIEQIDSTTIKQEEETPVIQEEEVPQSVLQINLLNGCGVPGIAKRIADFMREDGIDAVKTDNYRENDVIRFNVQNSFIIDRVGNTANARKIADALGIDHSNIRTEISPDLMVDATVVLGQDYRNLKYFSQQ